MSHSGRSLAALVRALHPEAKGYFSEDSRLPFRACARLVMDETTIIVDSQSCLIEVAHRDADPGTWIVRRGKKFLWFKKWTSSDWFSTRQQALTFADELKRSHDRTA